MKNIDLLKSMDAEALSEFLADLNENYDTCSIQKWFEKTYCANCPTETVYPFHNESGQPDMSRPEEWTECCFQGKCPHHETFQDVVRLWLDAEAEGNEANAVHLPCKKGDPLFVLTSDSPLGYEKTKCKKMTVVFREDGPAVKVTAPSVCDDWGGAVWEFYPEDFGIKVFTKESDARMFATRP